MTAARGRRARDPGAYPPYLFEAYRSTVLRAPSRPLLAPPGTLSEATGPGPALGEAVGVAPGDADLTANAAGGGPALGERIVVTGRVLDERGTAVPGALIEVWQANSAGRYAHDSDRHDAPLDPNFLGYGRCLTDGEGRYRFVTIRPGAYPWKNDRNAWRPAHIHFSVFGPTFSSRLVTQMYFPGDPLHALDPVMGAIPDPAARRRLVARYDHDVTEPEWALGFRWDVVLAGSQATPFEETAGAAAGGGSGRRRDDA